MLFISILSAIGDRRLYFGHVQLQYFNCDDRQYKAKALKQRGKREKTKYTKKGKHIEMNTH